MDAVQFGRWLHKRRRSCGFSSQRTIIERIQQDPELAQLGISEAFLARLETGQLVHPFRGDVRRRVLALAELLCHNAHDVSTFIHAAELTELSSNEAAQIEQLRKRLSLSQQRLHHLPAPPASLVGRENAVEELCSALSKKEHSFFLITGIAGVGKSTLAAEVLHTLAHKVQQRSSYDAIISFSCRGYQGNQGLLALCEHVLALFKTRLSMHVEEQREICFKHSLQEVDDALVSRAINVVRRVLANRSLLILLDDLDAQFPLHAALEIFGSQHPNSVHAVLATSRYKFVPIPAGHHLHLPPLSLTAALEYFSFLLHHSLNEEERDIAQKLCALVGNLPVALESLAAICSSGVPLRLLYETLTAQQLSTLFDCDSALYTRLQRAFASLNVEQQKHFALLSLFDVPSLGLEWATPLLHRTVPTGVASDISAEHGDKKTSSTNTALKMGNFVRHSLLELVPSDAQKNTSLRYQLHPMLRAYGQRYAKQVESSQLGTARGNLRAYALEYLEHHTGSVKPLLCERDILFACFTDALRDGHDTEVMRFVNGLTPISCRLHTRSNGSILFRHGIAASQQDCTQKVRFMHDFGWLCFHWGALAEATRLWTEALQIIQGASLGYWLPLVSFAQFAHLQCRDDVAVQYIEKYLHCARNDALQRHYAYAYVLLAQYKRLNGESEAAYEALQTAKTLLPDDVTQIFRYFMEKRLLIEDACLLNKYAVAHKETELLVTFLEQEEEHYDAANLLLEQAVFAQQQGRWECVPTLLQHSRRAAEQVDAAYLQQLSMQMAQRVSIETPFVKNTILCADTKI